MPTIMPLFSIVPGTPDSEVNHIFVGYLIHHDNGQLEAHELFDRDVPEIRQNGLSKVGIMETVMECADVLYHEVSREIRKEITSIMKTGAQRQAASETLSQQM